MEKNMQWMYEGPKSTVNRDDYLLGKKIDKNFELYSDVVVRDKDDRSKVFAKPSASGPATSLPVIVVRQEDPLAALKIREAKQRQAMFDNPAFKRKAQKVLMKEFEKMQKKRKKKHKKHSKSESSEDEPEQPTTSKKKSRSPSPRHKRRRERSRSPARHRRRYSSSPDSSRHRESSHRRRSPPRVSLCLINLIPTAEQDRGHRDRREDKAKKAAEMERKRQEMMQNVEWKEQVRKDNVKYAKNELEKEVAESNQKNAAFIKAFKQRTEGSTIAESIQNKRSRYRRNSNDLDD
ncbi:hypothetical protein M3Y98_00379400 [Aphelenchoides besseyi]|nr:hypothetical protein M3Y98_00379400 [Aphelenchoides besseyi]